MHLGRIRLDRSNLVQNDAALRHSDSYINIHYGYFVYIYTYIYIYIYICPRLFFSRTCSSYKIPFCWVALLKQQEKQRWTSTSQRFANDSHGYSIGRDLIAARNDVLWTTGTTSLHRGAGFHALDVSSGRRNRRSTSAIVGSYHLTTWCQRTQSVLNLIVLHVSLDAIQLCHRVFSTAVSQGAWTTSVVQQGKLSWTSALKVKVEKTWHHGS